MRALTRQAHTLAENQRLEKHHAALEKRYTDMAKEERGEANNLLLRGQSKSPGRYEQAQRLAEYYLGLAASEGKLYRKYRDLVATLEQTQGKTTETVQPSVKP